MGGSLLIDCCTTCGHQAKNPHSLDVDEVICKGCEDPNMLAEIAEIGGCKKMNGEFKCNSTANCTDGAPTQTCEQTKYDCNVYMCSQCKNLVVKAKCCQSCIDGMCSADAKQVYSCQGCDA